MNRVFREVRLLEQLRVTLAIAGLADDGTRFVLPNEFWRADLQLAARVSRGSAVASAAE